MQKELHRRRRQVRQLLSQGGTRGRARGRRQTRGRGGRGGGRRSQNVPIPPPINRADRAHEDRMARET